MRGDVPIHQAISARTSPSTGPPKAITATAHKLARIFYHLWKTGESYYDPGPDYYEQKYRERALSNIKKRAKQLGYEISLISAT